MSAQSAAWSALNFQGGHDGIAGIAVGSGEESEPLDYLASSASYDSLTLSCNKASFSAYTCTAFHNPNGSTQRLPTNTYVSQGSDHHSAHDDASKQGEYDYWEAPYPAVTSGTWSVGGSGFCPWSGDGTGCSGSTATNIATSLGGIDENDLAAAEADPVHGSLPYAISTAGLCNDTTYVYPATSSDGSNSNGFSACAGHTGPGQRPPEGTRWFIAMTDAQIDATNNLPYVKAILRTMDEQHMGGTITDTDYYGAPGLNVQYRHQSFGTQAAEAGLFGSFTLPVTTNGIDLPTQVKYCSNGTC